MVELTPPARQHEKDKARKTKLGQKRKIEEEEEEEEQTEKRITGKEVGRTRINGEHKVVHQECS